MRRASSETKKESLVALFVDFRNPDRAAKRSRRSRCNGQERGRRTPLRLLKKLLAFRSSLREETRTSRRGYRGWPERVMTLTCPPAGAAGFGIVHAAHHGGNSEMGVNTRERKAT